MLIATLTCCFNRKNLTFNSIGQLHRDLYPKNIKLMHYLVDDCSDDGTSELINKSFNDVKIIKTSGDLYWSRSMKLGWDYIKKEINPDFIFVYNDDTNFYPNCITKLLNTYYEQYCLLDKSLIVSGAIVDPIKQTPTYGGRSRHKIKLFTIASRLLPIKDIPQTAYTLNFNAALIPIEVIKKIGFIAPYFLHGGADWEFGYRCTKNDIPIIQAPGVVGSCSFNPKKGTSMESNISLLERFKRLLSIKEQPFLPRLNLVIRYGGFLFIVQLFVPYIKIVLFHFYSLFIKK